MRPAYHPRLINPPFQDPGLFLSFLLQKRAILFDLGEIAALSARDILKVSHVFVSHTHMDHFVGFDHMLRLFLGRHKTLHLFGPAGFLENIAGKLQGYTWNLVDNYPKPLTLSASEVHSDRIMRCTCRCEDAFRPSSPPETVPADGPLLQEPAFSVRTAILDHGTPCLGFAFQERFHVNILKARVLELGLETGPWLSRLKAAVFDGRDPDSIFEVPAQWAGGHKQSFALGDLAGQVVRITPGQKIAYITDVGWTPENARKIISLAKNADTLFIEAAFAHRHRDIAAAKHHLTARQAGCLAAAAQVKTFSVFHFSPRYTGEENMLRREALDAFHEKRTSGG